MALWTPAEITTALWLDADDSSTVFSDAGFTQAVNGNPIQQWNDRSGNNLTAAQATSGARPLYETNQLNGKPGITFAAGDFMSSTGNSVGCLPVASSNIFIVYSQAVFGSNQGTFSTIPAAGSDFDQTDAYTISHGNNGTSYLANLNSGPYNVDNSPTTFSANITRFEVYAVGNASSGFVKLFRDGTLLGTDSNGNALAAFIGGDGYALSARASAGPTFNNSNGEQQFFEVIVTGPLDSIIQLRVEGYLAHKWGLEANLPADHPYKAYAPGSKVTELTTAYNTFITGCKATAWTPADITTALWLDADFQSSVIEGNGAGNGVTQWSDRSGGNFDFTAPSTGPSLLASQLNGLDVLSFDGTANTRLRNNTINPGQPLTYFIVCQSDITTGTATQRQYVFDGDTNADTERQILALRGNNTNLISTWAGASPGWFSSGVATTTDWILVSAQFNGSSSKISIDGVTAVSGSVGNQNTASGLVIGTNYLANGDHLDGQIAEFIVVDQASFDTGNARRIEGYLAHKWGLTASLPVDHPYKDAAPTLWDSIKTACVMAGWDGLDGALTVLKGTDVPTNNNFEEADYDRTDGLKGDASTKYLDSGRANNSDPQNDNHDAMYVTEYSNNTVKMGDGNRLGSGANFIGHDGIRSRNSTADLLTASAGFLGISRNLAADYVYRTGGSDNTFTRTSQAPSSTNITVFSTDQSGTALYSGDRAAFYSIGESLDLAALDTLVTQLMTDIATAVTPTSLLLNCNGTNGSTTFTDSSSNAVTVTANGDAQISTAQSKFGGASAVFDGNGDFLSIANQPWMSFGTDNFTIETWFYIAGNGNLNAQNVRIGTLACCFTTGGSTANTWYFQVLGDGTTTGTGLEFGPRNAAGTNYTATYNGAISQTTWHHAAAVRNGNTITVYFNGASVATADVIGQTFSTVQNLNVGRLGFPGNDDELNGYIDDLRITKGAAIYTSNFTPPTSELTAN